jgi:zinc transporter ZupT
MSESIVNVLAYGLIAGLGIPVGSIATVAAAPTSRLISAFQHFAAGVVFAARGGGAVAAT